MLSLSVWAAVIETVWASASFWPASKSVVYTHTPCSITHLKWNRNISLLWLRHLRAFSHLTWWSQNSLSRSGNLGLPLLLPQLSGFLCSKCPGFLSASWIPYILHWHRALAYPVSSFISSLWNQLDLGFLSLGTVLQWNGMCECPYHWGKEHTQYTEVWMACSIILWRISFDTEEDKIRNYGWISSHHSWNIKSIIILTSVYVSILLILFALYSIE